MRRNSLAEPMNIRAIQYLVTLAEVRHFSKAAELCYVSQPTLSTQIRKLEEELGVQLVERSPRQVMLTRVGEEIVERARTILGEVEAMRAIARRSRDPHSGTLRLGIFPTLAPYLLPHVIPELRRQFPRLTLRLFEEKTEDLLAMLDQGRLDAGLLALPVADDRLVTRQLFEEPFVVAMPEQHALASLAEIRIQDLENVELLLLEDGHCLRDQALEVCHLAGAHEKLDFHATSMETLRQMVAAVSEDEQLERTEEDLLIDAAAVDDRLADWHYRISSRKFETMTRRLDDLLRPAD